METSHIIEPERHGLWIAASFTLALLALVVAFASLHRLNIVIAGTQGEVVGLNNKIEQLRAAQGKPQTPATPVADAAPAMVTPVGK